MEKAHIKTEFDVLISKPKVVSRFDIEKRGRVINLEGGGPQGNIITLSLIALKID